MKPAPLLYLKERVRWVFLAGSLPDPAASGFSPIPLFLGLSAPQNRAGHHHGDAQQSEEPCPENLPENEANYPLIDAARSPVINCREKTCHAVQAQAPWQRHRGSFISPGARPWHQPV